jgi:hypothetical protein
VQTYRNGRWSRPTYYCPGDTLPTSITAAIRARIVRLIPGAAIGLAPKTTTLVNIQTITWVETASTRTLPPATILGQRVTIEISIDRVDWDYGDGTTDTTQGPGRKYDGGCHTKLCPGYDGHVYRQTGRLTLHATAHWHASFSVGNGPAQQIPGTIQGPTTTATIHVRQTRGVLVENPTD